MKVLSAIAKGGVTLILILIIILLLIWFGGEQFHVDKKYRVMGVVAVLCVATVLIVIQKVLAVRSALLIEQKLKAQAQEQVESARPDQRADVQAVQGQLNEAIQALKTSRLGKGALYKLPWYMIIGPPGSGKSTALQESGLNFPFTSQFPFSKTCVSRCISVGLSTITGTVGTSALIKCQYNRSIATSPAGSFRPK